MILKTLSLKNFRNYESEEVVFHEKINILTGRNAQGKTNLIEAVNLLSLGKSFRTRKEQEMLRFGEETASVKGEFEKKDRPHTGEVRLESRGGNSVKKVYIVNGLETVSVADLFGGVYTVVFSPEDLRVVKGEPEMRRRFLDREIILMRPLYYHKLRRYKQILKTRNTLLKSENIQTSLLDVYDEQLAQAASEVMRERAAWLLALSEAAEDAGARITDGEEKISVKYKPCLSQINDGYKSEEIQEALLRSREKDILTRSTEAGPHRDDFSICASGLDLRTYGSQGQQRTAALSLRFAELMLIKAEKGEDAILLLDDVMSELDAGRQERLLGSFGESQIIITAAGPFKNETLKLHAAKTIKVTNGQIG